MSEFLQGKLTDGILAEDYRKVIHTLVHTINPEDHVRSFMGKYDENICNFAEPEFSGKYLDLCCKIYERYQDEKALENAQKVVNSILEYMDQDGYIGCLIKGHEFHAFGVWNQMFTIMGLLSFYRATGREEALEAGERCASYIMDHFIDKGVDIFDCLNDGTEHSSILWVLSDLYQLTGKEKYKKYMLYIIDRFRNSDLNFLDFEDIFELRSQKGIEIMIILMGILKYAELCDDRQAVKSVEKYWQQVRDTQIRNTGNGTINEFWSRNGNSAAMLGKEQKPNETCVAVGWIELSLHLFKITKEAKYLNVIDKTLYNHILASISENGDDFAYYQPNYGEKVRTTGRGLYKCCRYRGFTLFTCMPQMLCCADEKAIIPILYTNAEFETDGMKIIEKTDYPFDKEVKFCISSEKIMDKQLKLRVPEHYLVKELAVNDCLISLEITDGYVVINLTGMKNCEVKMDLEPEFVIETGVIDEKNVMALSFGQVLLALKDENGEISVSKDQMKLERVENPENAYLEFHGIGMKEGCETKIEFTDYASADGYRVWIPFN